MNKNKFNINKAAAYTFLNSCRIYTLSANAIKEILLSLKFEASTGIHLSTVKRIINKELIGWDEEQERSKRALKAKEEEFNKFHNMDKEFFLKLDEYKTQRTGKSKSSRNKISSKANHFLFTSGFRIIKFCDFLADNIHI